jgi:hypothetical protein
MIYTAVRYENRGRRLRTGRKWQQGTVAAVSLRAGEGGERRAMRS